MTEPEATTTNVAGDASHVGVQAGTVHGDVYMYTISTDDSPAQKFEVGIRYLDGGAPDKARRLIHEAVMARYVNNRVYFYCLLALISGRTRHELSAEDTVILRGESNMLRLEGEDAWATGVRTIRRLLDSAEEPDTDTRRVLAEFKEHDDLQHSLILRHMEVFLDGPIEDQMWDLALRQAERQQKAGQRVDRVWKFFEPDPRKPRLPNSQPPMVPGITWIQAVAGTAVLAAAAADIGYLLAQAGLISLLPACLLIVAGGYFGGRDGAEWRFRTVRRRAKDNEYRTPQQRRTSAPPGGFARRVDQRFDYYFAKYVPHGMDRQVWLAETAGIRRSMRDETVREYRESRVGVEQISWLIRYRVGDVKRRREHGTLWSYQEELATPLRTRATAILSVAALAGGGLWAVWGAAQTSPLSAARSAAFALLGGWIAARAWLHITLEHRRSTADRSEHEQAERKCWEAYDRWRARLADKPDDREMAGWLDCDRKVLLDEALRHYRLTMSNVIAHAFIEAAAAPTARARVRHGPWRYKKYRLLVFLLTTDGVRQLTVTLDFEQCTFHDRKRTNYRYEAVAAVEVDHKDDDQRTFELALVNGQKITVQVTGPGMEELQQDEDPEAVSEVTLDAAGLHHTLHVLEGIAAEGKAWIAHEHRRGEARTRNLAAATQSHAS